MYQPESAAATFSLLRTRLHRPRATHNLVPRPHLIERLNRGRARPLTLVTAPAGYGKTTLVSTWLEDMGAQSPSMPSAWLSLDENDSDVSLFLSYLLAAVRTLIPDFGADTDSLLRGATLPPVSVLATSLTNELDQVDERFVLALDDYHFISAPAVHELLNELLRHPPRSLHLVVMSRRDPPLALHGLRAKSQVTEVRLHDLQFTKEETAAFAQQEMGMSVDDAAISALLQRVEGWVTGLRLVTLSLHHRGSVDISPAHLGGTFSYVMDYLVTEVLDNQPSAMQDALIRTAILDRFSAPLCEAVCQGKAQASGSSEGTVDDDAGDVELSGQAFVAWLLENNPFLVRLDDSGEWYRYHHLLRELLQSRLEQRLGAEGVAALHRRASAWFAQNQLIDEALHHALAAGEPEAAANMVAQHRHALIDREQWQRLERWLLLFDQAKIERHAELSIIEAWLHNLHGRWQEESAVLARVENLLASTTVPSERALSVQGEIHLMRANLLGWTYNGPAVLRHTEIALELLPRQWRYAYTSAYMVDSYGHLLCGDIDLARKQLQHGLADPRIASQPQYKTMLLFGMAGLLWASLNLREMRVFSRQYLAHGKEFNLQEAIAVASYFLGCVHYLQNDLVAAQKHFSDAVETRYLVNLSWQTQAVCGLAITYYALDRIEQAMDVLDEFQAKLIERDNYILLNVIKGCRAELALREGNLAEAKHWAESYDPQPLIGLQGFYIPQLTLAKIWLAQDPPASNENGANLLGQLMAIAQSAHLTSALLPVLLVQSLLDEQVGDEATALNHLADAIHLAEPNGIIRAFVDIGSRMANLLVRLGQHGVAQDHIAQIIEAFPIQHAVVSSGHQGALIEPLTDRELEVLTLLAQRKRNQDIADELVITVGTVKQYTHNIYQKLGVKDRHAAVAKAVSLGILTLEP